MNSNYIQEAATNTIKRLSRPCPYPEWMLLELPNGHFAAFWAEGLEIENAVAVAKGDYQTGCAFIDENKENVLAYMARNLLI